MLAGDRGQPFEQFVRLFSAMGLYVSDLHIDTISKQDLCFQQHAKGFADAGAHANVDLELSAA
ncbi:MAG TPA: hypothetical protein VHE34_17695 [Puia sp.]|nr:hypothetical protein [Puia sp.]